MAFIHELFDSTRPITRPIEKVITYDSDADERLKQEVTEYVITESIEGHFENILEMLEQGMSGKGANEIGVWVSGFYGSGKSSFTKYLGFALDPRRKVENAPFYQWLQQQFTSKKVHAQLNTLNKHSPAVIMLDLASEMLAGATMAEISTVLYAKVMQWAGYARDAKVAHLEFMLERDGKLDTFKDRILEISNGNPWDSLKNQPLVIKAFASRLATEFYPDLFPDTRTFNEIKLEDQTLEDKRTRDMLDLIKRRAGTKNILIILDEVGQYIAGRDDLILNLDGLAKNLKNLGEGHVWIIATAQQTLTEDDPRAALNSSSLFKLNDRFPIPVELEASDIKKICYIRLLSKSPSGAENLRSLFQSKGAKLRHTIKLEGSKYYTGELNEADFVRYYPFLPVQFDILLKLLARLAKTRGGIGLRSAIKVIQDLLIDPGHNASAGRSLAQAPLGTLCTAADIYNTLHSDIERSYPYTVRGVERSQDTFGSESLEVRVAKTIAVLQILEDFPVSRYNVAACLAANIEADSPKETVIKAVDNLITEPAIPLTELDNVLRFMSEAVLDLDNERQKVQPKSTELKSILSKLLREEVFSPAPQVKLHNTRAVSTGFKIYSGALPVSLTHDKEPIQTHVEFVRSADHTSRINERVIESQQRTAQNHIFLIAKEDSHVEDLLLDICRCVEIYNKYRNSAVDREVDEYLRAQKQRAETLERDLAQRLRNALHAGSLIFRAQTRTVTELGDSLAEAQRKHLTHVAEGVFSKYQEAPVSADGGTAEAFLKAEPLAKIATKHDPLRLVQSQGGIKGDHPAFVSIHDYLEKRGQVDGRQMLDDLYGPPWGWSKDTTRYLISALLAASHITLRSGGEEITVRGEKAIDALRNNNSFNKVGVSLRDSVPDLDALNRAMDRLLELTGDEVMPTEEEISKSVIRFFPEFQKKYAPLDLRLQHLLLPGSERASSLQNSIARLLASDASNALQLLGGEDCALYDSLCWARAVHLCFEEGLDETIRESRDILTAIHELPDTGEPGSLKDRTKAARHELEETLSREDFHELRSDIQTRTFKLISEIQESVALLLVEINNVIHYSAATLKARPDWALLGTDDKERLSAELDTLQLETPPEGLKGLKSLLNRQWDIQQGFQRVESEMTTLIQRIKKQKEDEGGESRSVPLPRGRVTLPQLQSLLSRLAEIEVLLKDGKSVDIEWQ